MGNSETGFKALGQVALRATSSASRDSREEPGTAPAVTSCDRLPLIFELETDRAIPDRVVCFWSDSGEPLLRRQLTGDERGALERRRHELRGAVAEAAPAGRAERLAAISGMLGAFPAMQRYDEVTGLAIAANYLWAAREVPHWAILRVCEQVRSGRSAGINPAFCPSEPEFVGLCLKEVAPYRARLAQIDAVLRANVRQVPSGQEKAPEVRG